MKLETHPVRTMLRAADGDFSASSPPVIGQSYTVTHVHVTELSQ